MDRFFAFATFTVLAGLAALGTPVAAGTQQHVPQYFAQGREPWAAPASSRLGRPASSALVGMYLGTLLYDTYSGEYCYLLALVPETQSVGFIDLTYVLRDDDISVIAANAKTMVVLDRSDHEFLAFNLGNTQIFVTAPVAGAPVGIATDSQGNTYVSTLASSSGPIGVAVYPYGSATPSYTITSGIPNPGLLAVDVHDNLYVSNGNNIVVFPPGGTTPVRTISQGIDGVAIMTFDRSNRLVVYNSGSNAITIYAPKHRAPEATISDGLNSPSSVAVGPTGTVYVANFGANNITEYDHEQPALSRTITTNTNRTYRPYDIAVDSTDTLYDMVLAGFRGKAGYMYTFPHHSTQPTGRPWKFFKPRATFPEEYVTTANGAPW